MGHTLKKMKQTLFTSAVICALLIPGGCSSNAKQPVAENMCSDPRPAICTMQYDPVCGIHKDDTTKTYASDCTACSNKEVTGYNAGECP